MHNLITVCLSVTARVAGNAVMGYKVPIGMTLVGASFYPGVFTGTPTSVNIDIMNGSTAVAEAVCSSTAAGTAGEWLTTHFGGSNTPSAFAAGDTLKLDLNFVAGTAPTVTGQAVLTFLTGTV
jgi:hypothetical protein